VSELPDNSTSRSVGAAIATNASKAQASLAGFWALIAVQFQNAFSDNALKWLVSFLVLEAPLSKVQRRQIQQTHRHHRGKAF